MSVNGMLVRLAVAVACAAGAVGGAFAAEIFKANNTLPLNDPLSWEGGVVPGADDVAVFDERVTTNSLSFTLTNDLAWAGLILTNSVAPASAMIGTAALATNGASAATLTLGSNGVCLAGSGLALALNAPLALSGAQTWQLDRRNVAFNNTVSGSADWVLNLSSQLIWSVASGYSGNLIVSNAVNVNRFSKAGRWGKSFKIVSSAGSTRWEMAFTNTASWSELFVDRTASVGVWNGITSGGTLQFQPGDSYAFNGGRFTLDNGSVVQNGGDLSGYEVQTQYSTYDARYTISGGSLTLSGGAILGNGLQYVNGESRFLQKGGTVSLNSVKAGWSGCKYVGVNTYELTGGVFRITGARGADSGIHLSWNESAGTPENSGAFLMQGGWADIDQIALGRSQDGALYAVTNAFSLFKMTGGELVLGSRGLYAARSWNNGITNSGYAVKLQGGTLTAGDSWSSGLDLFLSDASGGVTFNTADTNGAGQRVVLNGAVYGPGALTKSGAGTLVLAGEAAYKGKTAVKAGTLIVGGSSGADCYRWVADSLTDTNAPVAAWADVNKGVPATNAVASQTPRLLLRELNGHNVVRFTSASSQYLAVEAAKSPISGATNFSIVVVFKTGTAGTGGNGYWYANTGLVDGEQGGIQNDWGMVYTSSGSVGGGAGYPAINRDYTAYSSTGYPVSDSQPHVAIYTWQGTNMQVNVDGRVTQASSTSTVVSARNTYRMLFGSLALEGGKYFNGDMAEIRIYRNRALTADEQNRIGGELSATYGVPGSVFSEPASVAASAGEVFAAPSGGAAVPLSYDDAAVWDADTLTGTNGSPVTAWASTNGMRTATQAAAVYLEGGGSIGGAAPTLAADAINGHKAVRFTGSARSALGVPSAENPLAGVTNFSVAVVFRASSGYGPNTVSRQWWECTGLIDAEEPGATYDWGLSLTSNGRVAAGIGNGDATVYSRPFDLCDGAAHVAVVSYNARGGQTAVMVDGLNISQGAGAHTTPRNVKRLLLGSVNGESGKFFTGDLAAFRLYPERVLAEFEMAALSAELAAKYGVRFVSRGNTLAPQPTGLGCGDVEIYSGAALVVPAATNAAVTLGAGQTVSGGGTVRGALALAAGAAVDVGLSETLTMDGLWLGDGALVRWHHSGYTGSVLPVSSLKTGAAATLQVVGGDTLPARIPFIRYTSGTNLTATVWTVTGGKANSQVVVNEAAKTLDLVTPRGMMILVR